MSRRNEGPAYGRALVLYVVLVVLLLGGCSVGGDGDDSATDEDLTGLPSELAEPAEAPSEPAPSLAAVTTTAPTGTIGASPSTTPGDTPTTSPPSTATSTVAAGSSSIVRTTIVSVRDASGDHGVGPAYADLVALAIETGGGRVRVTVSVGGAIPSALTGREVIGLGVDVYQGNSLESAYQLFADGGDAGWRAFLQGPDGFLEYPGAFEVGDTRVVFDVPASSLPPVDDLSFSVFLDRSSGTTPRISSEDHLPDRGTVRTGTGAS